MQFKPNQPQHFSAFLDERLKQMLQSGNLPRSGVPLAIEDDDPDDFDMNTPDGAAYGLNAWDTVSKHEIKAAQDQVKRFPTSSGREADKTAGPSPAETELSAKPVTGGNDET